MATPPTETLRVPPELPDVFEEPSPGLEEIEPDGSEGFVEELELGLELDGSLEELSAEDELVEGLEEVVWEAALLGSFFPESSGVK